MLFFRSNPISRKVCVYRQNYTLYRLSSTSGTFSGEIGKLYSPAIKNLSNLHRTKIQPLEVCPWAGIMTTSFLDKTNFNPDPVQFVHLWSSKYTLNSLTLLGGHLVVVGVNGDE